MWVLSVRSTSTLACMLLCAVSASAQQRAVEQPKAALRAPGRETATAPGQPTPRTANKPVTELSGENVDQMVAGMLALCNEEEAALGKFATEHAKHEDVKKFAKQMVKEHSTMATELQKWAPEATLMNDQARASGKGANDGERMAFNPLRVHQQIANRSIASNEKSLGMKKGTDFDMAYVGSQCVMHQQMIDKASVLREYVSPELRSSIDKGIEAAQQHLQQTHQLIETLAKDERASK